MKPFTIGFYLRVQQEGADDGDAVNRAEQQLYELLTKPIAPLVVQVTSIVPLHVDPVSPPA